jgi:hypothetical protein
MSNANSVYKSEEGRLRLGGTTKADGWRLSPEGRQVKAFYMHRATKEMRTFAKHLIAYEALQNKHLEANEPTAFSVSEKLRPYLSTLMGGDGFRALLSRALALATAEVPWLRAIHVKTDGTLEGLEEAHTKLTPEEFGEGRVVLLAQLIGLMTAFIGEILTLRLVRDVWPKIALNEVDFGNERKNEKTK